MNIQKKTKLNLRILYFLTAICLLTLGIWACSPAKTSSFHTGQRKTSVSTAKEEPQGFATPQEAVTAYLEGLRAGDLNRMIGTFALGNYIDRYISVLKSQDIIGTGGMTDVMAGAVNTPSAMEFYKGIAVNDRESAIVDDILRQYAVLWGLDLDFPVIGMGGTGEGAQFVEELSQQLKAKDFQDLEILGFFPSESPFDEFATERYQKVKAMKAENYGVDQIQDQIAVVDLGGEKSILFFEVGEYDGKWYNLELGGLPAEPLGMYDTDAGTMVLDGHEGRRLEREMEEKDLLPAPSNQEHTPAPETLIESEGFQSPEKAVEAYVESLKAMDLEGMMSAFAVESYVEHFNLPAYLEYTGMYSFMQQEFRLPVGDQFTKDINIHTRKKVVSDEIAGQFAAVSLLSGAYYGNSPMPDTNSENDDYMEKVANMVDGTDFSSIKILGHVPPQVLAEQYGTDKMGEVQSRQIKIHGAGGLVSCPVVFQIAGSKYVICPDVVQYNGKWYIKTMNGQLPALIGISPDFMGTLPIDSGNMPELEAAIVPIE